MAEPLPRRQHVWHLLRLSRGEIPAPRLCRIIIKQINLSAVSSDSIMCMASLHAPHMKIIEAAIPC